MKGGGPRRPKNDHTRLGLKCQTPVKVKPKILDKKKFG